MTKAERRALQEQQRLEKEKRIAAGLPKNAKKAAELLEKQPPSSGGGSKSTTHKPQQTNAAASTHGDDHLSKKKAHGSNVSSLQKNQVPWLLHLDASMRPDTAGSYKELHPAVKTLALYFSEYKIVGSNARCVAMLQTFAKVKHYPKIRPCQSLCLILFTRL
jgi:translation initiation factor eIF-2B subunit delta